MPAKKPTGRPQRRRRGRATRSRLRALRGGRNPMPRRALPRRPARRTEESSGRGRAAATWPGTDRPGRAARAPPRGSRDAPRANRFGRRRGRWADAGKDQKDRRAARDGREGRGRVAGRSRRSESKGRGTGKKGNREWRVAGALAENAITASAGIGESLRNPPFPAPVSYSRRTCSRFITAAPLLRAPARAPANRPPSPCTTRWRR